MYQAALIASAVRESWRTGYSLHSLRRAPRGDGLLFCPDVASACQRAIELRPK